MAKRYFKATNSLGTVATRSSESRVYDKAFIPNRGKASWASAGHTPPEASRRVGEICPAVEIDAKEYRALRA